MLQCLKCGLEFGDSQPDYCPVCHTICYVCPWCGQMTDASSTQCSMLDCQRTIKYVRMTPDLRDVMLLGWGQTIEIGNVDVTVERALYSSGRVTVYRGKVTHTIGGRKSEPSKDEIVIVREVLEEITPRMQELISRLQSIKNPNIVRFYACEVDKERSCYYLLQSWAGDETLATKYLQESGGSMPSDIESARIASALASAIQHLHANGVIHCDITPYNVLLKPDGTPVLSDFGIACLVDDPGKPAGYTPHYAPVEMHPAEEIPAGCMVNRTISAQTDWYMLGTTLYSIACGFEGKSIHPVTMTPVLIPAIERILYELGLGGSPQPSLASIKRDVDPNLAGFIESLMSMSPGHRLPSDTEITKQAALLPKQIGKRVKRTKSSFLPFGIGRIIRYAAVVFFAFFIIFLLRHSYTLRHSPKNLPALLSADLNSLLGRDQAAIKSLMHAPVYSAETCFRIGAIKEQQGKINEALWAYRGAIKQDSNYSAAKKGLDRARGKLGSISLQRGLQLYKSGEYYPADEQLSTAVWCGKCSADGYEAIAHIAEYRGDLLRAAKAWESVSKLRPGNVRPHYLAGGLFLDSGRIEKAYYHTSKAKELHDGIDPQSDVDDVELTALIIDVHTACIKASGLNLHSTKSKRRIWDKMVWLNRARSLYESAEVYVKLGLYYERLGNLSQGGSRKEYHRQAVEMFGNALKIKPGSESAAKGLTRLSPNN